VVVLAPTVSEQPRKLPHGLRQCQSSAGSFRVGSDSVRRAPGSFRVGSDSVRAEVQASFPGETRLLEVSHPGVPAVYGDFGELVEESRGRRVEETTRRQR
jgi:hypothetical protein